LASDTQLRLRLGRQASQDMAHNGWAAVMDRLEAVLHQAQTPFA
jgi:hypothetical protein